MNLILWNCSLDFHFSCGILQVENLQPSGQGGVRYKNTLEGLTYIVRNQGWKKLFSGLSINYIKVISYSLWLYGFRVFGACFSCY